MDNHKRTVKVFRNDKWEIVSGLLEICAGDSFTLTEPNGDPVVSETGESIFVAKNLADFNENGVLAIECEALTRATVTTPRLSLRSRRGFSVHLDS